MSLWLVPALGAATPAGAVGEYNGKAKVKTSAKAKQPKVKPPCKNALHRLGAHKASRLSSHAPLKTAAQLKKAFADKKFQKIVQRVFDEAKLGPVASNLIGAVSALPDDAQPKDVPVGAKFDWMAYRKHGKPRLMFDACWAGKGPFQGWVFSLPGGPDGDVDLVVPVPCGNVSRVQPPTCVLKTDKNGDTVLLDLTGSTAGSVPIASYGAKPDLPQNTPGVFQATAPKCDPGAVCSSLHEELWVVDSLGLRSAASSQCTYDLPAQQIPPICKVTAKADNKGRSFTVDTTGSGVAIKGIAIAGDGPEGGHLATTQPAPGSVTLPYGDQVKKSGNWTFGADVEGQNGMHATCKAPEVLACVLPTAKLALTPPYNCETRQFGVDVNGSSEHRVVTVTGPGGPQTLTGNGPTWTFDVKHSGHYTVDLTADEPICANEVDPAKATASVDVAPFGDTDRWSLRLFGAYLRSSDQRFGETLHGGTALEERRHFDLGGHHGGFGAGFEYRPLHNCDLSRWGVAVDVFNSEFDSHIMIDSPLGWGMGEEKVSILPVLLSFNYHFTPPSKAADFFIGPTIGYAFLGDAHFHTLGLTYTEGYKDDVIYGVNFGFDVPFGAEREYALTFGLRQLFLKAKATGASNFSFDVNPTVATAGFAFRFR